MEVRGLLVAEVPQQPLLGDGVGNPGQRARLQPLPPGVGHVRDVAGRAQRAIPLSGRQALGEAQAEAGKESPWTVGLLRLGFGLRRLAGTIRGDPRRAE